MGGARRYRQRRSGRRDSVGCKRRSYLHQRRSVQASAPVHVWRNCVGLILDGKLSCTVDRTTQIAKRLRDRGNWQRRTVARKQVSGCELPAALFESLGLTAVERMFLAVVV